VPLSIEYLKLLSKEQSASLSKELVAQVKLEPGPPCEERSVAHGTAVAVVQGTGCISRATTGSRRQRGGGEYPVWPRGGGT
jgi:hypothetical protein